MKDAEWLELEREILARDRAAFVGERPLAGWKIDGRKHQYLDEQGAAVNAKDDAVNASIADLVAKREALRIALKPPAPIRVTAEQADWFRQQAKDWPEENARETH